MTDEIIKNEVQQDEGKKLIQEQKKNIVESIISGEQEKPKKKRGRPKGSKNKTKKTIVEEQPVVFDPEKAMQEGEFFLSLCETIRKGIGIDKPIPEFSRKCFISSYVQLSQKYGDMSSEYMPEIMFAGSLILIGYDTYKELKVLKDETEQDNNDIREKGKRENNIDQTPIK